MKLAENNHKLRKQHSDLFQHRFAIILGKISKYVFKNLKLVICIFLELAGRKQKLIPLLSHLTDVYYGNKGDELCKTATIQYLCS